VSFISPRPGRRSWIELPALYSLRAGYLESMRLWSLHSPSGVVARKSGVHIVGDLGLAPERVQEGHLRGKHIAPNFVTGAGDNLRGSVVGKSSKS